MIEYWFEFRRRIIICIISYFICFGTYCVFYESIYHWLTLPIIAGQHGMLVSQDIIGPLVMPIQLSASLSLITIMPIVIYQLLSFIRPALYPNEKKVLEVSCAIAILFFYIGCAISFFIVEPVLLDFVKGWLPKGILFLPTVSSYMAFSLDMAIAFGVAFECPIVVMILVLFDFVSVAWVRSKRPWWVVGLFFIAMILTPPDVYSQIALALPIWGMMECVLFVANYLKKDLSD